MKNLIVLLLCLFLLNSTQAELLDGVLGNEFELSQDQASNALYRGDLGENREGGIFIPLKLVDSEKAKILAGLGAVGILLAFDQDVLDFVQDHSNEFTDRLSDLGDVMGTNPFLPGVIFGTLGIGLVFKNDKLKRTAYRAFKAAVISALVTETLKSLSQRSRPSRDEGPYSFNGPDWQSNNTSFPSGHSTAAWAVATVYATEFSENKWVPPVLYSLAAITSWSRVHDDRHWASDVVLGALIGYVTGKIFTKKLFKNEGLLIVPTFGDRRVGLQVHYVIPKKGGNVVKKPLFGNDGF